MFLSAAVPGSAHSQLNVLKGNLLFLLLVPGGDTFTWLLLVSALLCPWLGLSRKVHGCRFSVLFHSSPSISGSFSGDRLVSTIGYLVRNFEFD